MFLGAHFPVRPTLLDALRKAEALGCQAIQIFGYRRHEFYFDPGLDESKRAQLEEEIKTWRQALAASPVRRVAVHSRAVAILAHRDPCLQKKSVQKFQEELALAQKLGAHYYVFHLGPYAEGMVLEEGLKLAGEALASVLDRLPPDAPKVLLENVPGGGRRMGSALGEWAAIFKSVEKYSSRFGFCVDLSHLWGAGFEINTAAAMRSFLNLFRGRVSGPIEMFHFNNSKLDPGCRRDEHSHLREGHIPAQAYGACLEEWPQALGIIETPKDFPDADRQNLDFLRGLAVPAALQKAG